VCVTEMVISMLGGGGGCWRDRSRVSSVSVFCVEYFVIARCIRQVTVLCLLSFE
jgi:hypothetical protein